MIYYICLLHNDKTDNVNMISNYKLESGEEFGTNNML